MPGGQSSLPVEVLLPPFEVLPPAPAVAMVPVATLELPPVAVSPVAEAGPQPNEATRVRAVNARSLFIRDTIAPPAPVR